MQTLEIRTPLKSSVTLVSGFQLDTPVVSYTQFLECLLRKRWWILGVCQLDSRPLQYCMSGMTPMSQPSSRYTPDHTAAYIHIVAHASSMILGPCNEVYGSGIIIMCKAVA